MGYQGDIFKGEQMAKSMSSVNRRGKNEPTARVPRSQRSQGVKRPINSNANYNNNLHNIKTKSNFANVNNRPSTCNYPLEFLGLPRYDD